jgi:glycosyltransferase involved in cell wall biosynthesis
MSVLSTTTLVDRGAEIVRQSSVPDGDVRLSVVVPNYNTAQFVGPAVRSILRQTMSALEVIVIDDGSSDDSVAQILAIDDPRLTLIRQPNRGLAGARNTGILIARASYIGLCDSDDLWHPDKAARHLAVMDADAAIGLTFSFSEYLNEAGAGTGRLLVSACAAPNARDLVQRNHLGNGSTPILRREAFELAGLFDEQLNAVADLEMWFRVAALTPLSLVRIPDVLTGYRVRDGSMSVTFDYFLADARRAADRFRELAPQLPASSIRRGYAESVRIASRKALAAGNVAMSRRLLIQAVREYPMLPLTDVRAFAMLALHVASAPLPERVAHALYEWGTDFAGRGYALVFGRRASQGVGEVWKTAAA